MRISLIQINSGADKEANFQKTKKYIVEAASQKSDVVCLPEVFLYSGDDESKKVETLSSLFLASLKDLAKTLRINIVLGSVILLEESAQKPKNTCLVIDRQGEVVHRYDKQYMYDVERKDFLYRESDNIEPGREIGLFELEGVKVGVGICVDLRYPEYFRELTKKGAEIIFLPSNFRKATGQLAWDVLTKTRAIENQLYFCACGQTGGVGAKERVGRSRIISFDGAVLSEIAEEEGLISAEVDLNVLRSFRKEFPALQQIRGS